MNEELTPQKERFLQEVERKLLRRELDARLLEDGLIYVKWNEKPLCSVDRDGIVRFRPADITGPEVDKKLQTAIQTVGQIKEYMRIFERAPALKATGLDDTYKAAVKIQAQAAQTQPETTTQQTQETTTAGTSETTGQNR